MRYTALLITVVAILAAPFSASAQELWEQFAHPSSPHLDVKDPNVYVKTSGLFSTPGDAVQVLPVLVVLMEFSDTTHRPIHTEDYWYDLVFGDPRPGTRPSVAEVVRANSNGRLVFVPASAGDRDGNPSGVAGWVASSHTAAELSVAEEKRGEAIKLADTVFDFDARDMDGDSIYDKDGNGYITTDELLILAVFADNDPVVGLSCDMHVDHEDPADCVARAGGNTRKTSPPLIYVDGQKIVFQHIAGVGEIANVGVVVHELGHSNLGLGDLYNACNEDQTRIIVPDGYLCDDASNWYPPQAYNYTFMDGYDPDGSLHLDPWAKMHLGFVKPVIATHDGRYTLYDAETDRNFSLQDQQPEALVVYDPLKPDPYKEYFMLEVRNAMRADDQGLAVWHIDETGWSQGNDFRRVVMLMHREGPWPLYWHTNNESLWDGSSDYDPTNHEDLEYYHYDNELDAKCGNLIDDDGDYMIDEGCPNSCSDGIDNGGDGVADRNDTECDDGYDLTATSTPRNTRWADGSPSYIEIYDVSAAGGLMTFSVRMPPLFVDASYLGTERGTVDQPYNTIQEAVAAIPEAPRTIGMAPGEYRESLVLTTPLTLKVYGNDSAVISGQ